MYNSKFNFFSIDQVPDTYAVEMFLFHKRGLYHFPYFGSKETRICGGWLDQGEIVGEC